MYKDLREFIELVDKLGALRRIDGADPNFEIGAITEVAAGRSDGPALLFDAIKGFPRGFRVFTNATTNPQRAALALGIALTLVSCLHMLLGEMVPKNIALAGPERSVLWLGPPMWWFFPRCRRHSAMWW